jgi:hypothetical protein
MRHSSYHLRFLQCLGSQKAEPENRKETACGVMKYLQVMKSMCDNGLRMRSGISYNPKVFRNKAIPGGSVPGCTGSIELRHGV